MNIFFTMETSVASDFFKEFMAFIFGNIERSGKLSKHHTQASRIDWVSTSSSIVFENLSTSEACCGVRVLFVLCSGIGLLGFPSGFLDDEDEGAELEDVEEDEDAEGADLEEVDDDEDEGAELEGADFEEAEGADLEEVDDDEDEGADFEEAEADEDAEGAKFVRAKSGSKGG